MIIFLFLFNKENVKMFEGESEMPGTQQNFGELGLGPRLSSSDGQNSLEKRPLVCSFS